MRKMKQNRNHFLIFVQPFHYTCSYEKMMMTMTKDPNVSLEGVVVHHMVRAMLLFATRVCHTVFLDSILFCWHC